MVPNVTKISPLPTWRDFAKALEAEFGPSIYQCLRAYLFKLAKIGTMRDYYMVFTSFVNRVDGINREALMDCFLSGLQDDICHDVKALSPVNIGRWWPLRNFLKRDMLQQISPQMHPPNPNTLSQTTPTTLY